MLPWFEDNHFSQTMQIKFLVFLVVFTI
uniref:Uncharacterized protein n=1 Tax=Anguilla anguilla TaxID=7936 RepID=A0A0E9T4M2_ANGAN